MPRERPHSTGVESATHTSGKAGPSTRSRDRAHDAAGDRPLGPNAAQILGTEHWSLLAARSLIWNEAQSRATVFLTVHAYLEIEPGLERYLTTGHHDDERSVLATYMLDRPTRQSLGAGFALVNTPTIVATVDAALVAAIVVLLLQVAEAPRAVAVAGGVVAFLAVWGVLFRLQLHSLRPLRGTTPRFPTPADLP